MKIKQKPEDFIVKEVGIPALAAQGPYTVYQLAKQDIGTIEAINLLAQTWHLPRQAFSFGGLKDRHARTTQLISIYKGPKQDFENDILSLKFLGYAQETIRPASFNANQFKLVLRDLAQPETEKILQRLGEVKQSGIINYFDEQRFGSVRGGNDFLAKQLIRGDFEGALKNALTATAPEDRRIVKGIRYDIRDNWGNWQACFDKLPRSSERSIINYLRDHPTNSFHKAFELIDPNTILLYLHAYQSFLWNNGATQLLTRYYKIENTISVPYLRGRSSFVFYSRLENNILTKLKETTISFITHKTIFPNQELGDIFNTLLTGEGIQLQDFRIRHMKKTYFRKGERQLIMFPNNLEAKTPQPDELKKGKLKLELSFELPKGSYATILIKRLSHDFSRR